MLTEKQQKLIKKLDEILAQVERTRSRSRPVARTCVRRSPS